MLAINDESISLSAYVLEYNVQVNFFNSWGKIDIINT